MTDDEQDFFNKSIGKLEKEIIALKKEYKAEYNRADELEDSLQKSWQNENKLKELLRECNNELKILRMLSLRMASKEALSECDDLLTKITNAIGEKK